MLNEIIEEYQHLLELAPIPMPAGRHVFVEVPEHKLIALLQAAKLLVQIHKEADEGLVDGVDLKWICQADELILGIEAETQQ